MLCNECKLDKSEEQFYKDLSRPKGRVARCIECYKNKQKIDRINNTRRRFAEIKSNAIRRGFNWELTLFDYESICFDPCYFCGDSSRIMGIDRKNNEPYYNSLNTIPCCKICNGMKSDMKLKEFLEHVRKIVANAAIACGE